MGQAVVTGPGVLPLGGGQVLLRGAAVVDVWYLAKSAADQASRRDGISLSPRVRDLLAALEAEACQVIGSVVGSPEFRGAEFLEPWASHDQISTEEAARMLKCTDRWVRYRAESLGGRRIAGRWVFSRAEVVAQIADQENPV